MAHDVFVSYATDDKVTADAVVGTLEQRNIRCWVAPRDIPPGKDYAQALVQAIHGSRVLVLVFSAKANDSPHVIREIERAASRGIPILPLRIEDVMPSESMEYFISGRHWLDALTPPLRKHLDQLAGSVAALLEADSGEREATDAAEAPQAAAYKGSEAEPPSQGVLGLVGRWRGRPMLLALGAAVAVALVAIGGFFVFASGGDGDDSSQVQGADGAVPQEVTGVFNAELVAQVVTGDCISEDLVLKGGGEGEFIGDISGHLTGTGEIITYVAGGCLKGYIDLAFTLTDIDENTLSGSLSGPLDTVSFLSNTAEANLREPGSQISSALSITIFGGSGIYEGITGTGTCSGIVGGTINPDGSAEGSLEGLCTIELVTAQASLAGLAPLIVQLAASPLRVPLSPGSFNPVGAVALAVLYGNTQEETLTGLKVRLPVPQGAEILGTTLAEAQPVDAGERIWELPDLAPGELTRFEFLVQIQAAETPTVVLLVTVDGEGFGVPLASNKVTIEIVQ